MARSAAEVVVRFAETTVALAHVSPGEAFAIGRSRDADLVLDVAPFTLVESTAHGFEVRAAPDARPVALEQPIDVTFGHVTLRVSLVTRECTPVPRRRIERRPFAFGAASLAVHAGILLVATWLASSDEATVPAARTTVKQRPARIARFAVAAQTVKREPKPAPTETPITADDSPSVNPATDTPSPGAVASIASAQFPHGRGEQVPSLPDSQPSMGEQRSERRFDPDANPAFDTVKVGKYTTVATGSSAGASFRLAGENGQRKPLIVVSCDSSSCVIIGGDPTSGIREALEGKLDEILGCYEQHAATAGKKVELDFGIDDSGKVDAVNVGGVGDYDSCVADIINGLDFAKR